MHDVKPKYLTLHPVRGQVERWHDGRGHRQVALHRVYQSIVALLQLILRQQLRVLFANGHAVAIVFPLVPV